MGVQVTGDGSSSRLYTHYQQDTRYAVASEWIEHLVKVRVSVRRFGRFGGLYAFHSSGSVMASMRRPRTVALVSYKATASSTLALLQHVGHWVPNIRSKSTSENGTAGWGQKRSRTSSVVLMVRMLLLWDFGSLARWVRGSIPPLAPHCIILVAQSSPNP